MANDPHLFTFTGNALAESTFDYADWAPGKTQRAQKAGFQMGGKGINVTKMLLRLGTPSTALCFLGGASGRQCSDWLLAKGIPFTSFPSRVPTRMGLVVRAEGKEETTFLGPDAPADSQAWKNAGDLISDLCKDSLSGRKPAVLALCGSIPGWASEDARPFRECIGSCISAGFPVYVDCYGPPLAELVQLPVQMVKINAQELRGLFGTKEEGSTAQLLQEASKRWPAKSWVISDGPRPLWFCERGQSPACLESPKVKEVSATGSGDVLFASLLHALLHKKLSLSEALSFAMPLAAANAAHPGIAEFPME